MANWYVNSNGSFNTVVGNISTSTNQLTLSTFGGSYTPQVGDFVYTSNTINFTSSNTSVITAINTPWNGTTAVYTIGTGIINTVNNLNFNIYNAVTYANSAPTLTALLTIMSAGDTTYIANTHTETTTTSTNYLFPGTLAAPNRLICTDTINVPPQASDLKSGTISASIITTGSGSNLRLGGSFYAYGVNFVAATGSGVANILLNQTAGEEIFENCNFKLAPTSGIQTIFLGNGLNASTTKIKWINCQVSFGTNANLNCGIVLQGTYFEWKNTLSALNYTVAYTNVFKTAATTAPSICILDGVDFSYLGAGKSIFTSGYNTSGVYQLLNCELGSSALGVGGVPAVPGCYIDMINTDSVGAGTGNRQERYQAQGTLTTETTVIEATPAAASDGVQAISWKVITTANSGPTSPFECFPIIQWVNALNGQLVATIDILTSTTPLTNADVWVDAEYLGTIGTPISSLATSGIPNVLTAGTTLPVSTSTWNGSIASPQAQTLSVNFTCQIAGYVRFSIRVAKPNTTLYVNPIVRII